MSEQAAIFEQYDPRMMGRAAALGRWLADYWFRFELRGLDNLPDGPCLVVGNHSALGFVEELMFESEGVPNPSYQR